METLETLSMYYTVSFDELRKYEWHHQFSARKVEEGIWTGNLRQPYLVDSHNRLGRLALAGQASRSFGYSDHCVAIIIRQS